MEPSVDRIAQPWGGRTPYDRHGTWPVRVDTHLAAGVEESQVQRWVRSALLLHSDGDAMDVAVRDGAIVGVRGRAGDRVNHGRLGPKDLFGWQANGSRDRLTRPLVREGGRLVESDWPTAMDRIVRRSRDLLERRGRCTPNGIDPDFHTISPSTPRPGVPPSPGRRGGGCWSPRHRVATRTTTQPPRAGPRGFASRFTVRSRGGGFPNRPIVVNRPICARRGC